MWQKAQAPQENWQQRRTRWGERALRWLTASVVRSTAIFVVLSLVPILLLTYYIVASSLEAAENQGLKSDYETRGFALALMHTSYASEAESLTAGGQQHALRRALRADSSSGVASVLAAIAARHHEFASIAWYRPSGLLQAAWPRDATLWEPLANRRRWFDEAQHSWYASSVLPETVNSKPVLLIAAPVDWRGKLQGIIAGALPASVPDGWVRSINRGNDRFLYIFDRRRHAVALPTSGPLSPERIAHSPALRQALSGRTGTTGFLRPIALESNSLTFAPLPNSGQAVLVVRPERLTTYVVSVFYDKLAVIAVIVFVLAVVSGLLLRAAFRYYLQYTREVESGRNRNEALLGSIGDGVFAVDERLRVIEFNRAAGQITRWPPAEAQGRSYDEVFAWAPESPGRAAHDPIRQAIERREALRYARDLLLVRRDGSRLPVSLSAAPVLDDQGQVTGCVAVINDASQEREVDRMKTEFISIASHQLRTPMSGVKGALSLLLEDVLGKLNPQQREYLRRAYEANERLIALVNDLLNVSRLEQGQLQMRREALDLGALAEAVAAEYQARAQRYRQQLLVTPAAAAVQVMGDPMRLREVLANLVDNAIKYTPEGGRISLAVKTEEDRAVFEVCDTGVGIPAEQLPHLFQKFTRIQNPLSAREFGSGLGLYFARSVVELHQGTIQVESKPGQGTCFRVLLPAAPEPAPQRPQPDAAAVTG